MYTVPVRGLQFGIIEHKSQSETTDENLEHPRNEKNHENTLNSSFFYSNTFMDYDAGRVRRFAFCRVGMIVITAYPSVIPDTSHCTSDTPLHVP